jgi:SRSO17 transposase
MDVAELATIAKKTFEEFTARFTSRFLRSESRTCFTSVLRAHVSPITRKNGWQIAEEIGDTTPCGVQDFLSRHRWEPDDLRDDLQRAVIEHFGEEDGVFVGDETGFLKKGIESAGVGRQYTGTAGGRRQLPDRRFPCLHDIAWDDALGSRALSPESMDR